MRSTKFLVFFLRDLALSALFYMIAANAQAQSPIATEQVYIQR
jgi:hypothetical protein